MKKILLLQLFLSYTLCVLAQKQDAIIYILPDNVEVAVDKYISNYSNKVDDVNYFIMLSQENRDFRIVIIPYNIKTKTYPWLSNTTRYVTIKDNNYPLLFDYDMIFGLVDNNKGEFGSRDGNIRRAYISNDGYFIEFKKDGTIIKDGY